jgi:TonB family protein
MREDNWYKWLFIAMLLHVLIIGAFSVPIKTRGKKIDLSSYYSVNLVGDMGGETPKTAAPAPPAEVKKPSPPQKAEPKTAKPPQPKEKERPTSTTKERSLAPIKKEVPESMTKDDVRRLDKRIREMQETTSIDDKIREMRKRTQYMDVSRGAGRGQGPSALPSSGGSVPLDPAEAAYQADVWEMIRSAWHSPLSAKKDLQTLVTITIRKDGRITDWQIDQRSESRAYDESVTRTLRSIDKLPPIPASLNMDSIQMSFDFHPAGDLR